MIERHFLVNVNDDMDVIHDPKHLTESCNTDDIEGRAKIDARSAAALLASGQARNCQHCIEAPAT